MEHVGHHHMPHGKHKISIHHHEGHHDYYPHEFDSHEDADKHVKEHFRFVDAFPGHARKYIKEHFPKTTDIAHALKPHVKKHFPHATETVNKFSEIGDVVGGGIHAYHQSKLPEYIEHKVAPYVVKVGELINYPELGKYAGGALQFGSQGVQAYKSGDMGKFVKDQTMGVLNKVFTEE